MKPIEELDYYQIHHMSMLTDAFTEYYGKGRSIAAGRIAHSIIFSCYCHSLVMGSKEFREGIRDEIMAILKDCGIDDEFAFGSSYIRPVKDYKYGHVHIYAYDHILLKGRTITYCATETEEQSIECMTYQPCLSPTETKGLLKWNIKLSQ